jgi:hypothetical protein
MGPFIHVKDIQKLTGCIAALNRFILRLANEACHSSNSSRGKRSSSGQKKPMPPLKTSNNTCSPYQFSQLQQKARTYHSTLPP